MSSPQPNTPPASRTKNVPSPAPRWVRLIRPLLWACIITLLIFGVYEIIERLWLTHVEMQTLHLFHTMRGIFSTLFVAGIVGWMIIRTSPRFLEVLPVEGDWVWRPRPTEAERAKTYAQWFIAMRWIAVLLSGILVFISVRLVGWLPQVVWWPLVATVGTLAALNLLYTCLLRWERSIAGILLLQGYVDLVILTILLHFSGGIENPLSMMMIFHVIIGGILLSRSQCYGVAAAASALFGLLALAEWADMVQHYTLRLFPHVVLQDGGLFLREGGLFHPAHHTLYVASRVVLQTVVLALTAYFVTTLAERLRQNEMRFEVMADRAMANRQLLERALETTGAGLRVLNRDLQPFWSSNRWNEWFVCDAGETCPGCELLNRQDSPASQCLRDGRVRVTEVVLEAKDCPANRCPGDVGQRVFQITTAALLDAGGNLSQVVELAQEVTEQKKTQAQILQAEKLAAVGELAGQVAHEVNNPISIISAKATLLLSRHRSDISLKVAEELAKITELAKRVARIAQGLLSYCRPSAATRVRLDLRVPIGKSLAVIEEQARRAGVRIDDQLPEHLPAVQANPHELEQVFLNLLINALDAMPKGGWLTLSAPPTTPPLPDGRPAVAVEVADTGCGITPEIREKIFAPFFTTKQEGRGTGLGLSICLGIVRSHGGDLAIDSKIWQGTRVTVRLPVDAPAVKEERNHG